MITLYHVYYEIHDEVSKNDKVYNSFIKVSKFYDYLLYFVAVYWIKII